MSLNLIRGLAVINPEAILRINTIIILERFWRGHGGALETGSYIKG